MDSQIAVTQDQSRPRRFTARIAPENRALLAWRSWLNTAPACSTVILWAMTSSVTATFVDPARDRRRAARACAPRGQYPGPRQICPVTAASGIMCAVAVAQAAAADGAVRIAGRAFR